jgi:hypothetical protein
MWALLSDNFPQLVMEVFNQYNNHNFLLQRSFGYNPVGRNQKDLEEAKLYDFKVKTILDDYKLPFDIVQGGEFAVNYIIEQVVTPLAINTSESKGGYSSNTA